ncbi:thiol reductant ABC exporter subunit CydD [Rhodospira trueperi]|uniref:ATP-binding cassette, subfamily C, CydD n=1 Tax=Rhodospira trueperi TaxID=69960 RepID=A0A1G7HA20_9PROT|nr:thiol reductant ABC exporter subunit CydD [Rhodospira trueperi]SDE96959.1 ATP-binding cassette, subfamily C, CydD [Rhodospira trueperi]
MTRAPEPLVGLLPAVRGRLIAVYALNALAGGLMIANAALLAGALHRLVFGHGAPDPTLWILAAGLIAGRALATWAAGVVAADLGLAAQARVRRDLFATLTHPAPTADGSAGRLAPAEAATLATDGVEALTPYLSGYLPAIAQAAVLTLAILAVVLPLDWISGLTLAVTAPLIPLFMILIGAGAERLNVAQWAVLTRLSGAFLDAVQALPLLRLFGATAREGMRIARAAEGYRIATMKVLRVAFLSALALEILATLGVALVAVFLGFRLLWGMVDYDRALFILLLAPEFYLPLRALGAQYHARMDALAAAERLAPVLRGTPATPPETIAAAPVTGAAPRVVLEHVSFAYAAAETAPILTDLSVTLEPGTLTALVGASGGGKSTLLALLRGVLHPTGGRILVDGDPLDPRRHRPAWVPQAPRLFAGTIADALRLGAPDAPDAALWEALRRVGAEAVVSARPLGLATPLGEGGRGLSGGEIRRLALARALLADAPLVLMDEPSASLDHASEEALIRALNGLRADRTVVIAAHRLSTLQGADRILVLEGGHIVEEGSFANLSQARQGAFARLMGARSPLVAAALAAPSGKGTRP